jgi:hypothetical protein
MVNRSILERLNVSDDEAIDLLRFTKQQHNGRPISVRMQRRVLKMFATWENDNLYQPLGKLARKWDIDDKTLRYAVAILVNDNRLVDQRRGGKRIRGVNWQAVHDEVASLACSGDSTGQFHHECPEPTGQLNQKCPESSGQLKQNCPVDSGTTARTYKDNVTNQTTTTTTKSLCGEWLVLKDELFGLGMQEAVNAACAACDRGWTVGGVRWLIESINDLSPGKLCKWLKTGDGCPFTAEEANQKHVAKLEALASRQAKIASIRENIRNQGEANEIDNFRILAKCFRALQELGFADAITDEEREAHERYLIEGPLPTNETPDGPIEKLIQETTRPGHERRKTTTRPRTSTMQTRRDHLARQLAMIDQAGSIE